MPILVTGATGTVGASLVRQLVDAGEPVRAMTRKPDAEAAGRLPGQVEIVRGDYAEPDSMRPALREVRAMYVVTVDGFDRVTVPRIMELARTAGVRRVVHLGHNDYSRGDDDPVEAPHRAVHRAIEGSGLEWTHLFPGEFMVNTWEWADSIRDHGLVRAPFGDWNSAMIHEADVAAVAMAALLEDGHSGRSYQPTGPEPIRRREAVRILGQAIGREIEFVELTPDQAREQWRGFYPADVVEWFLQMGENLDGNAWVSPDVERVTRRRGRRFTEWARDHADDFR